VVTAGNYARIKGQTGFPEEFKNNPIYDKFAIKEKIIVKKAAILDS
jgi:hypothetical protein